MYESGLACVDRREGAGRFDPNCGFDPRGKIQLVLNPLLGPHADGVEIRKAAIAMNVPLLTMLSAAMAAVSAIQALGKKLKYRSLQSDFGGDR